MDEMKELVIQASQTFYGTQDKEQRRLAEEWLDNFKKSTHAWYITDQILHTVKNEQVLFFAAQTIRTKIQYNFHELPAESHESLRNSLIEHLENLRESNLNTVQKQICVALSDLIMLMNTWHNPLPDIIQRFSKYSQEGISNVLIEFLTILPEEISNKRLKLGQNRRDHLKRVFSGSSTFILQYLESCLKSCVEKMQSSANNGAGAAESQSKLRLIYKCFSSWIQEHLIDANLINQSQLFLYTFHLLCQPDTDLDLHEEASNCLVNMLLFYPFNARATEANYDLLVSLKQNICNLTGAYRQAEAKRSTEKCIDFCLIFTELCNALSFYYLHEPNSALGDMSTVNLILLCGTHAEYEVFQKSFLFWFNISEEIYTNPESDKLCKQFRDYVYTLVDCVCKHCRLDHETESSLRNEEFEDFRLKASDLIADVVFIVEANKCFEKMYMTLQAPNSSWFEIEAALYIMCSFSKSISQDEERSVAQVIQSIVNLPEHVNNSVKMTGIRLVGELCEWLNHHPQFIDGALNFVCSGFMKAELSSAAANTMLSICTQCQQHMVNHFETLLNIVLSTDNAQLPSEASMELLKGAVVILCNLPPAQITQSLLKISEIQLDGLSKVISGELRQGAKASPLYWLDRLTAIFRTIRIKNAPPGSSHPCAPVVERVWPTLSDCFIKYQNDAKTTESCCRALRFVLRSAEKYSNKILDSVVRTMIQMYQVNHYSCFLYVGSIIVDIFGTEGYFKTILVEMMQVYTNEAFNHIIQNCKDVENISELRKHPDTIDDFFRLALRFMQRCPLEFINSLIFSPIMTLAVTSISIDHRDANLSVTKFLAEFVALSHKPQIEGLNESNGSLVNRVLAEIGLKMIENTINSTINMTTRDTKDGIADLICELLSANRKQVEADLLVVIKNLRKSNQLGSEIVTERQLIDVHTKILNSNSSGDIENALFQLEQLYL